MLFVVSPLIEYIRYQQVERLGKLGLRSACLEESQQSDREVVEGRNVQVIFGSVEQWLSAKCKKSRTAEHFKSVFTLVVDEV